MKNLKTFFLASLLLLAEAIYGQTTVTWNTPLPTAYRLFNSDQGLEQFSGSWGYNNGVANSPMQLAEGESVTAQVYLSAHTWGLFIAPATGKTKIIDDQDDNSTWTGSDATVLGIVLSLTTLGSAQAFENGTTYGSQQALSNFNYVRIFYENATTVRYQYSTDGTNFTTFQTSAVNPSGSYYIFWQSISNNSIINLVSKTTGGGGGGGNQAPTITPINDVVVTLPTNSTTLSASASDPDGSISTYSWVKISGPSGGGISSPSTATTNITSLQEGTYLYRLTVTDNGGATASEDVGITVLPQGTTGGTGISTTIIPFSDPEIMRHFAGAEDWNFQNEIAIPTSSNKQKPRSLYFRWRWFEIEGAQGVYDWTTFDAPLKDAIDNGQTYAFGIMAHDEGGCNSSWYTNKPNPSASGTCMAYPLYLHNLMVAEGGNNVPFVSGGNWIPNYNSPNFLARWKALNEAIYNHLNTTTYKGVLLKNVINYVDIRAYGTWGEWHAVNVTNQPQDWPTGRQPTVASLDSIIAYTVRSFPDIYSVMIISALDAYNLPNVWNDPAVAKFALTIKNASGMFVGIRNDHIGDLSATYDYNWTINNNRGSFDRRSQVSFPQGSAPAYVPFGIDTASMNRPNLAPWLGEPPGNNTALTLPRYVRYWRYNSFGNGNLYAPLTTGPGADSGRLASKLAGHRIQITGGNMPTSISPGGSFFVTLNWRNVGLTPCYDRYYTILSLRSSGGTTIWSDTSSFQPYLFLPGTSNITDNFVLPSNAPAGSYNLFIRLIDPKGYREALPLAIQGRTSDGSYLLASNVQVASGGSNQAPTVTINSINQTNSITLPTNSITLTASATDADGTISSYSWVKASGPAGTITSPTASSTTVTGMVAGTYIFEVTVTDNGGLSAVASRTIVVNPATPAPVSPTANAGADSTIQLPKNTVTLIGSGTDPDGTVVSYTWTKFSGPSASIVSPTQTTTRVENLVAGVYVFRLTVTDNNGSTGTDDVVITVLPEVVNVPPSADAGPDQVLKLPIASIQLSGSGADTDGTIASYLWQLVSGPSCTITNPSQFNTTVTNLQAGVYTFQLTVTDNLGAIDTDLINVYISIDGKRKRFRIVKQ